MRSMTSPATTGRSLATPARPSYQDRPPITARPPDGQGRTHRMDAGQWLADDCRLPQPHETVRAEGPDRAHGVQGHGRCGGGEETRREMGKTGRRAVPQG